VEIGFFDFRITLFQEHRLGDQYIVSTLDLVDIFNKMGPQQSLGPVSVNCISYFFTGDKPYAPFCSAFIEKYEIGSMPCACSLFVDQTERFTRFEPGKVFYTANLFLPLALRAAITFLPFFVFIRVRKPCVLFLGVLCGWYVLFIANYP